MGDLIYTGNTSLDGYMVDAEGRIDFAVPDDEYFTFITALEARLGTYLYGRRMYETMAVWNSPQFDEPTEIVTPDGATMPIRPEHVAEFASMWRAADKVVFSRTLDETAISTPRTRLERDFKIPSIRDLKDASAKPISVGGPTLAAQAFRAGLVDELHQFVYPVMVGGGTRFLPEGVRAHLELVDEFRFASGLIHLHYRVLHDAQPHDRDDNS